MSVFQVALVAAEVRFLRLAEPLHLGVDAALAGGLVQLPLRHLVKT